MEKSQIRDSPIKSEISVRSNTVFSDDGKHPASRLQPPGIGVHPTSDEKDMYRLGKKQDLKVPRSSID